MDTDITFEAFRIHQSEYEFHAGIERLCPEDLTAGEVDIWVHYSSVNYKDALAGTGSASIIRRASLNGGIDLVGTVISNKTEQYTPGDAVLVQGSGLGEVYDGGFSHYVRVPVDIVLPLPKGLIPLESMIIGTAGFTAALCIEKMQINGQSPESGPVLVTGATGGVGSFAIQLLSQLGYECIAVSRKQDAKDYLLRIGATKVIDEVPITQTLLAKQEWAGAIDMLGGSTLAAIIRGTRESGNVVSVGLVQSANLATSVMPFIVRGVNLLGVSSTNCPMSVRRHIWQQLAGEMKPKYLDDLVADTIALADLPMAFQRVLDGKVCGRIVVDLAMSR